MPATSKRIGSIAQAAAAALFVTALGPAFAETGSWKEFHLAIPSQQTTTLIGVEHGSALSRKVGQIRSQGYESSAGQWVSMDGWYRSSLKDLRLAWMTALSKDTGFIWGLGTGERGEKYVIAPSLRVGFVQQAALGRQTLLSMRATTVLGGRLREKGCTADYGAIGGVQQVNCRLAASSLAPAETLRFLMNESPADRIEARLQITHFF